MSVVEIKIGDTITFWDDEGKRMNSGTIEKISHLVKGVQVELKVPRIGSRKKTVRYMTITEGNE